jgi:hypothetical protein
MMGQDSSSRLAITELGRAQESDLPIADQRVIRQLVKIT